MGRAKAMGMCIARLGQFLLGRPGQADGPVGAVPTARNSWRDDRSRATVSPSRDAGDA
jgi:hypothetical protein